ncbi:MAG: hypothetical protein AMJ89_05825 [candidate division Zixibacteria bacterium SM23_73]|nr:MAG: hypothetical protein AMJ89_05825 [candidate division Zixibacteria bacterium SM23_73]
MQKRMSYVFGLLIILFFGSSIVFGTDSDVCPVYSTGDKAILDLPQGQVLAPGKSYSVPRNQVLLETFGRTT